MNLDDITVLLVEDEPITRAYMLEILSNYKFKNIYSAINGQDGLSQYNKYSPDIVLTDYSMPILNGLEMSKVLKIDNPELPIILITAMNDNQTLTNAINAGIDGYLFKPLELIKLTTLINKFSKRVILQKNFKKEQRLLKEYKAAIDVSAAVSKTNTDGIITYVNDSFCEMSGYSKKELIGVSHKIVRHPDTKLETYVDMWKMIKNKKVWQGTIKNLNKDGGSYYTNSVIVPILNDTDDIVEYIALRQDITSLFNQKQLLKKRVDKEVNKNLQLHKQREEENLLEAKFSTIGRMAAGITHEINTPLTYARGNLELMLQDIEALDENIKQKKYLQEDSKTILDGINRIAYIVESMREMASQTKELPQLKNIYTSLITALTLSHNKAKFISNITIQDELFELGMDKKKFEFNAEIQSQRIEQVFVIIINNALDALNHINKFEDRMLQINLQEQDDNIIITIKDNGGGIDNKILPKIFNPFQSTKEEGGMGIGLNVAKRIIDDHNGKIIPSNHDNGAQFKVYIPKINTDKEE